jgi:hypothetical protein
MLPELSILISGLIERIDRALPLYYKLLGQTRGLSAEVLILMDNRLAMPLKAKRNQLLAASRGRFIACVDDDDDVSDDYAISILDAIAAHPETDIICFQQSSSLGDGLPPFIVSTSLAFENEQCSKDDAGHWLNINRKPWHWCAWRGDLARQTAFIGSPLEDWLWVQAVLKRCSTETIIPKVLHFYRFDKQSSVALNNDPDQTCARPRFCIRPNTTCPQ